MYRIQIPPCVFHLYMAFLKKNFTLLPFKGFIIFKLNLIYDCIDTVTHLGLFFPSGFFFTELLCCSLIT